MTTEFALETLFATERPRLVRLCGRLSGNWDAAEDLAQETLFQAWRHVDRLQRREQATPWLFGIARNVCLHWCRRHYREQAHLVQPAQQDWSEVEWCTGQWHGKFDFEAELERHELVALLDRALALLPMETRTALVQTYVEESPHAEIAARLGLSENAVAVRIHRGKVALRRIWANALQDVTADYGWSHQPCGGWETTRIWCPVCGQRQLQGRFAQNVSPGVFELSCLACGNGVVGTHVDLALPFFAAALGKVKSYKPAYTRLLLAMGNYYQQALTTQSTPCLACGGVIAASIGVRNNNAFASGDWVEARVRCQTCGWESNNALGSFAMIRPEVQQFWRAHPRMQTLPPQAIEHNGAPALVTRLRSVTAGAGLDIVALRDTFKIVGSYSVGG